MFSVYKRITGSNLSDLDWVGGGTVAQNAGFGTLGRFCPPYTCYAASTIDFWCLYASNWGYKTFLNASSQSETSK